MKRSVNIVFALVLAFCFAFASFGSVHAGSIQPGPTWGHPTAVPSVKGAGITSEVLGQPELPGTAMLKSGEFVPVGFPLGEAQFGGSGLKVSGMTSKTTATLCFSFPSYQFKWTGKIEQWNGTKWVALDTTITSGVDGGATYACTNGAGNGTYALIIWYYGPIESPYRVTG